MKSILKSILLLIIFIGIWLLLSYFNFPYRYLCSIEREFNLDVIAIVLAAVAAFAGLLIPLHYVLTLDIMGKMKESCQIKNNKKINKNTIEHEKEWLRRYCHTSDIVVFVTALFGVSSLLEGGFAIGLKLEILTIIKCPSRIIGISYMVIVLVSILISCTTSTRDWMLESSGPSFWSYFIFLICLGSLSIIWGRELIYYRSANITAFLALIALSLFYFLWLLLRILFTPMSRVMHLVFLSSEK